MLDLDVGSMVVFKNSERLGVMTGDLVLSGEVSTAKTLLKRF